MTSLLQTINGALDRGVDYIIAREERKDASRLPTVPQTPNEYVVQSPAPSPSVQNDRMVPTGASTAFDYRPYIKPVLIGVAVATISGLAIAGIKSAMKGSKK